MSQKMVFVWEYFGRGECSSTPTFSNKQSEEVGARWKNTLDLHLLQFSTILVQILLQLFLWIFVKAHNEAGFRTALPNPQLET